MKRRKKFKKNWLIACVSALVLTAVGGVLALLFLPSAPESNEPKKLETPTDLEYTINLTTTKKTEYILSWSFVKRATGYEISVSTESETPQKERVDIYTSEYDIANLLTTGESNTVSVTALGDEDYANSEVATISIEAEEVTTGLSYKSIKGGYEVSKGTAGMQTNVVIPDTYNGSRVKKISDWGFGWNGVGFYAPQPYLESIRLPKNLEEIGFQSFRGCINLGEIVIPDSVIAIGENAFANCAKLQTQIPPNLTRIEDYTFFDCESLKNIKLPKNLTYIGVNAFENTGLTKITIPDSVKHIGNGAFKQMLSTGESARGIETIEYSLNLQLDYMGKDVFWGTKWYKNQPSGFICFNDTLYRYKEPETDENIVIESYPEGITKMADGVFENCDKIVSVVLPDWIEEVCEYTFSNCSSLKTVQIPNGVKKIDEQAFNECVALENIQFSSGLKEIGVNAFRDCELLEEINLPNGLEEIGAYAFAGCKSLTSVVIPDGVTTIGESAFFTCANLTSVVIPNSIILISAGMFSGCNNLTEIIIPNSVEKIEVNVIYKTAIESVIVPKSVKEMDIYAFDNEKTKAVYYEGSKEDWENITRFGDDFSDYIEYHVPPVYYYSETEPTTEGNYWYYDENGVPKVWEYQGE